MSEISSTFTLFLCVSVSELKIIPAHYERSGHISATSHHRDDQDKDVTDRQNIRRRDSDLQSENHKSFQDSCTDDSDQQGPTDGRKTPEHT